MLRVFSACCQVKAHYPEACLVLRIRADDPSALCQLGVKFGSSSCVLQLL